MTIVATFAFRPAPAARNAIGDLGSAQKMIADNEIDIAATQALVLQAYHALDTGQRSAP